MNRMMKSGKNTNLNTNVPAKNSYAAGDENPGFISILPPRNTTSKFKTVTITTASSQNSSKLLHHKRYIIQFNRNHF